MKDDFSQACNDNRDLSYRAGTRGRWCRGNLEAFRNGLSSERLMHDGFALFHLFDEMEKASTAWRAVQWARKNRVEFIVDHTVQAGGYYHPGSGVVALSHRVLMNDDKSQAVGCMTHEIRHAWQDYHGLIYTPDDTQVASSPLARDLMIEAMVEADAEAHAALARAEYEAQRTEARLVELRNLQAGAPTEDRARLIRMFERAAASDRAAADNPQGFLWESVQDWYAPFGLNDFYGDFRRREYAAALGLAADKPDVAFEYLPDPAIKALTPVDYAGSRALQEQLGRSFAGVNYITTADRDRLLRQHLSPSAADRYFDDSQQHVPVGRPLQKLRACQLRNRMAARPLPRLPLPK